VKFKEPTITADEVRAYRDLTGTGMMEAKRDLRRHRFATCMEAFRRDATLEDKVEYLLDRITEQETGE